LPSDKREAIEKLDKRGIEFFQGEIKEKTAD
jgi:hypothetical protein